MQLLEKNYGCNHIIIGRDHAWSQALDVEGKPYYQPYDAQELINQYQEELEIKMVPFQEMVFAKNKKTYLPLNEIEEDEQIERLSGTQFKELLEQRTEIPNWYSFPEIIHELRRRYPKLHNQGLTVFFTGLSGAGKIHFGQCFDVQAYGNGRQTHHTFGRRYRKATSIK